ncbi:uncharacterized protein LOC128740405 [Sabethes cyaneus]|uniref:uncharacterized protein LOC128740405 n=1 Tax=Sabethes cyaneus TaxID=53552 RepID=UPI00237DDADA|nr:uncharacterized protein LOC128740405 [Sabethes cyaneus]
MEAENLENFQDLLISAVYARKELWDQTSVAHRNRVLVENTWKQLAEEFSCSGDAGFENCSTWPYFQQMSFLKHQVKPRKSTGNLSIPACQPEYGEIELLDECVGENSSALGDSGEVSEKSPEVISAIRKRAKMSHATQLLEIENRKLEILERKTSNVRDEDEAFFDSLLPYIRKLEPARKLYCRMELQKIIMEHVYATEEQHVDTPEDANYFNDI